MPTIGALHAYEILDSRGIPTVRAVCRLEEGGQGDASVPSGRSTGRSEAAELRDGDPGRYQGLGCRRAVAGIAVELNRRLKGREFADQGELDGQLIAIDGTEDKSRLGANALLAVSLAYARAVADQRGVELFHYFGELIERGPASLPRLTVNLFSGGMHGGGQVPIQDVLLVPMGAVSVDESMVAVQQVFAAAAALTSERYGSRLLTADEGGLAPPFSSIEAMFDDALAAIEGAGEGIAGMALAVDVAATHFQVDGRYRLGDLEVDGDGLVAEIERWVIRYPIVSVEDGLGEDDWRAWRHLRQALDGAALVVGDDLLCSNPERIRRAIEEQAADTLLLKVNQIGSLSEAAEALRLARAAGWSVIVSARSGETEDDWLADLAVGWSADYVKIGSITQSERLAKYNRLLQIEADTGLPLAPHTVPMAGSQSG